MTLNIELPDELMSRLEAAGIPAEEASRYALAALNEVAEDAELRAWWDDLSSEERLTEAAKTRDSLAAADSGQSRFASDVHARVRSQAIQQASQ
jgi:hypothetical protein